MLKKKVGNSTRVTFRFPKDLSSSWAVVEASGVSLLSAVVKREKRQNEGEERRGEGKQKRWASPVKEEKEEDNGHRAAVLSLDTFCQLLAGLYYTEATSQRVGKKNNGGVVVVVVYICLSRRRDEG
jgi:hypothetical protein